MSIWTAGGVLALKSKSVSLRPEPGCGRISEYISGKGISQCLHCIVRYQRLMMLSQKCAASCGGALEDTILRRDVAGLVKGLAGVAALRQQEQIALRALSLIQRAEALVSLCNDGGYIHDLLEGTHQEDSGVYLAAALRSLAGRLVGLGSGLLIILHSPEQI